MILLIDNYDSFVHNLARYFQRLGQATEVVRNDAVTIREIRRAKPQAVVLSPGPCTPHEAGSTVEIVRELHREFPMLGICLGHQAIAAAFGGGIVRAPVPMHGRTSEIEHFGSSIFERVPSPFTACRYHSLVIEPELLPAEFAVTATCDDGAIMAIEHAQYPVYGMQFHPEAILTEHGFQILANYLALAGIRVDAEVDNLVAGEHRRPKAAEPRTWRQPVTF